MEAGSTPMQMAVTEPARREGCGHSGVSAIEDEGRRMRAKTWRWTCEVRTDRGASLLEGRPEPPVPREGMPGKKFVSHYQPQAR